MLISNLKTKITPLNIAPNYLCGTAPLAGYTPESSLSAVLLLVGRKKENVLGGILWEVSSATDCDALKETVEQ